MRLGVLFFALTTLGAMSAKADSEEPTVSAGQKLVVLAKPSVVRVVAGYEVSLSSGQSQFSGGHGSGFFAEDNGYIITNAHVVETIHISEDKAKDKIAQDLVASYAQSQGIDLSRAPESDRLQAMSIITRSMQIRKVAYIVLPNGDKLTYDIKAFGTPVGEGGSKDVAILKVQTHNAPTLVLGDDSRVALQDKLYAIGYPGAADDLVGVLDQNALLEATITDGNVSALKKTTDGIPVIQMTTNISPGNSGGPVLNERGEVVGLATFQARRADGYNFLVPSSTVKEFLKQAGVQNKESVTNVAFKEAMNLHWQHRYTDAIKKFEEVRQLYPAHSAITGLIQEAQEQKQLGKERKASDSAAVIIVISSIAGLGLLGAGIWLLFRKPKPALAAAASGSLASSLPSAGSSSGMPMQPNAPHPNTPAQPHNRAATPVSPIAGNPGGSGASYPAVQPGAGNQGGSGASYPAVQPGASNAGGPGMMRTVAVVSNSAGSTVSLVCVGGLLKGQLFHVGSHGITIGRDPAHAQVVLPDSRVSTKHAWIGMVDGQLQLVDHGSTNGTFVNDMNRGRITRSALQHGDKVIVSETDVLVLHVMFQR